MPPPSAATAGAASIVGSLNNDEVSIDAPLVEETENEPDTVTPTPIAPTVTATRARIQDPFQPNHADRPGDRSDG